MKTRPLGSEERLALRELLDMLAFATPRLRAVVDGERLESLAPDPDYAFALVLDLIIGLRRARDVMERAR